MAVKGEIIIKNHEGSELEGPRENNSCLVFEFEHQVYLPYDKEENKIQGSRRISAFSIVKDIDKLLKLPQRPTPKDPALEHIDALAGKPFQAFPGQDHRAHIKSHLSFMATNMARNNPVIMASLEKNIFEHISNLLPPHNVSIPKKCIKYPLGAIWQAM